ncbi:MAG: type III-A CRISPR-associated RAMP protein Csm3 [Propionivibrio sp.]|uniref:type III-A CRISPR-associated RAMP protein Csm3 n=1 Tax=Propionivibrio sp. TaxID=2212460 RepID=UPI001B55C5FA|nr:type III-A CRISPR-associated RAMP protein Csm3 [Propionivibrio sp.]MBP7204602.1 type III-A CRISPR-associated RAMP protein Csm3 [Propionivibrio sp.]
MQLIKIQTLEGTLELLSGLRIGASEGEIRIGGVDNQVIRNPINNQPYIPGSSLKGKVRSLLEWRSGAVKSEPLGIRDLSARHPEVRPILQLFGVGGGDQLSDEQARDLGPTRLAFWDAALQADWVRQIEGDNLLLTEIKTENRIDRIKGVAEHPRQTERVPAGSRFDFRLSIKVLDIDGDGAALRQTLLAGLRLLELDSLGGSGSRGYGKIKLRELKLDGANVQAEFEALDPFAARAA